MFLRHFHRGADLDERSFTNARAILAGVGPSFAILHQFGPKGKCSALGGLGGMQTATMLHQERALFIARLAKPHLMPRAIDVFFLEGARRHAREFGRSFEIVFRQVDETVLVATIDAASLAGETESVDFSHFFEDARSPYDERG